MWTTEGIEWLENAPDPALKSGPYVQGSIPILRYRAPLKHTGIGDEGVVGACATNAVRNTFEVRQVGGEPDIANKAGMMRSPLQFVGRVLSGCELELRPNRPCGGPSSLPRPERARRSRFAYGLERTSFGFIGASARSCRPLESTSAPILHPSVVGVGLLRRKRSAAGRTSSRAG